MDTAGDFEEADVRTTFKNFSRAAVLVACLSFPMDTTAHPLDDFVVSAAYTNFITEQDDGASISLDYNIFGPAYVGVLAGWNRVRKDYVWKHHWWGSGTVRAVFPGTDVADFQAFAAVGSDGQYFNFRLDAGPKWKTAYVDISLTFGFLSFGEPERLWRGFGATFSIYFPGSQ